MIEINVCVGSSCHLRGSYSVIQTLRKKIEESSLQGEIEMKAQFCMKQCQQGVSVSIGDELYSLSPDTAEGFFEESVMPKLKQGK